MTTPTRPKRAAKKGKPATTGERIASKWEDVSVRELRTDDYGSSFTLAKQIDAAIRRAVRETAQSFKLERAGAKCSALDAWKKIETKYGVRP